MSIALNSFSSSLMLGTTIYRNQPGISNKLIAQAGYALIAVVSAVESAAAFVFYLLSLFAYPFSSTPFEKANTWLDSSTFSLGWSVVDFVLNIFTVVLVADEKSARRILDSRNLLMIPHGAIL